MQQGQHTSDTTARLGAVPTASNKAYQDLFDNNPYRNLRYNKSFWQKLVQSLGFRTDADRWEEEVMENAAQWDAGVYQQIYQDQYNSESAKAERMREAGENPDLLGTGNVENAASPYQDPAGLSPGTGEEDVPGQIASSVMQAFNSSVSMATQLLQLDELRSGIEGRNIGNAESMMRVIQQRVIGLTPAEGFQTDKDFQDWRRKTEATLRTNYGRAFFKGSSLRRWNRSIDDFIGTLPTSRDQYAAWKERLGSAKDYLLGREDHWSEVTEVFKEVNKELIDLRREITENKAVAEKVQSEVDVQTATNELQYQEDLEPGERARAENESNKRRAEGETFEGILNKHLTKLGERLDNLSRQGGLKGLIGEFILLLLTMKGTFSTDKNGNPKVQLAPPSPQG